MEKGEDKTLEILIVEDSKYQEAEATKCVEKKIQEGYKIKIDYVGPFEETKGEDVIFDKIRQKRYDGVLGGPFTVFKCKKHSYTDSIGIVSDLYKDTQIQSELYVGPDHKIETPISWVAWCIPGYHALADPQHEKDWQEAVDLLIDKIKK
jgi:hypothetical protein